MQRAASLQSIDVGRKDLLDAEDFADLDEAPEEEIRRIEEEILDQATAASTIQELKAEIDSLKHLESLAAEVKRKAEDTKWVEMASLLQAITPNNKDQHTDDSGSKSS